jgi:hypothetical protein
MGRAPGQEHSRVSRGAGARAMRTGPARRGRDEGVFYSGRAFLFTGRGRGTRSSVRARVAELVDAGDSKSPDFGLAGSSPASGTSPTHPFANVERPPAGRLCRVIRTWRGETFAISHRSHQFRPIGPVRPTQGRAQSRRNFRKMRRFCLPRQCSRYGNATPGRRTRPCRSLARVSRGNTRLLPAKAGGTIRSVVEIDVNKETNALARTILSYAKCYGC